MTHRAVWSCCWRGMLLVTLAATLVGCGGEQSSSGESKQPAATPNAPRSSGTASPAGSATTPLESAEATPSQAAVVSELQEPSTPLPDVDVSNLPLKLQMKIGASHNKAERDWREVLGLGELGALYYVHGFPDAAIQCFQRASEIQPDELAWTYYLALARDEAGRFDQAIASYQKFINAAPDYQPARLRWGRILLEEQGSHERAAEVFEAVLTAEPNDIVALFGLGKCALAAGRTDEARELFQRVIGLASGYAPAHAALAGLLRQAGAEAEAEAHARRGGDSDAIVVWGDTLAASVRQRGLDVDALLALANTFLSQNEPAGAEAQLRLILGIEPENITARTLMGTVRILQGQAEKGAELLREVLAEQVDYIPAQVELGLALFKLGQHEAAEEALRAALKQDPKNIRALQRLCGVLSEQGRVDEAVDEVQAFQQRVGDDARALLQVAELFRGLNRPEQSVAVLQQAVELDPSAADVRFALGMELAERGDMAGARVQWEAAVETAPTFLPPRGMLVNILREEGDYEGVKQLLEEGLRLQPGLPQIMNDLAWMLATCPDAAYRDGARAVELAEQAAQVTRFKDHPTLDTLAAAYAEVGRFDDARKWINEAQRQARMLNDLTSANMYAQRAELYASQQPYRVER